MKITEEFPKLLKQMYENCHFDLDIEIISRNNEIILAGVVEIKLDIERDILMKCYFYMVDAGYLVDSTPERFTKSGVEIKSTFEKKAKLTAKAIDFIESLA